MLCSTDVSFADIVVELVEFGVGAVDFFGEDSHGATTLIRSSMVIGSEARVLAGSMLVRLIGVNGHWEESESLVRYPMAMWAEVTGGPKGSRVMDHWMLAGLLEGSLLSC